MLLTKSSSAHATNTFQSSPPIVPHASYSRSLSLSHSLKRIFFHPSSNQQQQQQQPQQSLPPPPSRHQRPLSTLTRSRSFGQHNHKNQVPSTTNPTTIAIPINKHHQRVSHDDQQRPLLGGSFDNISRMLLHHHQPFNHLPSSSDISSLSGDDSSSLSSSTSEEDDDDAEDRPTRRRRHSQTIVHHHRNYHHTIAALPSSTAGHKPSMRLLRKHFVPNTSRTVPHSRSASPTDNLVVVPSFKPVATTSGHHQHHSQQLANNNSAAPLTWCTLSASTSLMGSQILEAAPNDESVRTMTTRRTPLSLSLSHTRTRFPTTNHPIR